MTQIANNGSRFSFWLLGGVVAFLSGLATWNMILNNSYQVGPTLYDSAIFATLIWHNDWGLHLGPALDGSSFYYVHVSPIHYIPSLLSYFFPWDRISFFALFYSVIYAAVVLVAYCLIKPLCAGRFATLYAALGALALFCSQALFQGAWEPHMEIMSPLFVMLIFRAWQLRQYRQAALCFILNAMIREDLAISSGIPLIALGLSQYYALRRREPLQARKHLLWITRCAAFILFYSAAAFLLQKIYFPGFRVAKEYYDLEHFLAHVNSALLKERALHILHDSRGIWLPLFVLAAAGVIFRDIGMLIGGIGFLPYYVLLFFSKHEMMATLGSYSPFIVISPLLWPAILAIRANESLRRHYLKIQCLVLLCSMSYIGQNTLHEASYRWERQPFAYHAEAYREFGEHQLDKEQPLSGHVGASHGILALYPYQFPAYWLSQVSLLREGDQDKMDTLIWFDGDRDQQAINRVLKRGHFSVASVPGTKIKIAHSLSPKAGNR